MMGSIAIIGMLSAMLLPETLKQNLPETLEDAVKFGKGHKFWSIYPTVEATLTLTEEAEKLNEQQQAKDVEK